MGLIKKKLSTIEIHSALSTNRKTAKIYAGTYPHDMLPQFALERKRKPAAIVINQGDSQSLGTHWTLLFFPSSDSSPAFYFDSFGLDIPDSDITLHTFINRNSKTGYFHNDRHLQHLSSSSCGYYILVVAYLLAAGTHPANVTKFFSHANRSANDNLLKRMAKKLYHIT